MGRLHFIYAHTMRPTDGITTFQNESQAPGVYPTTAVLHYLATSGCGPWTWIIRLGTRLRSVRVSLATTPHPGMVFVRVCTAVYIAFRPGSAPATSSSPTIACD